MTTSPRAQALTAAIRDIARDLHADLGKLDRFRGTDHPSYDGPTFLDPGPDLETYEKQKAGTPGRVDHTLSMYRSLLSGIRDKVGVLPSAERAELLSLIESYSAVDSLEDAAALVATFGEA